MKDGNLFFISHSSNDNAHAMELYNLLLEINPEWKGRIFLDCCEEKPLESHAEWRARMLKEVENSRHLIFITSDLEYVKEGNGWLFEEVSCFQNLKANRNSLGRGERNISYFGIFLCECDFENALFNDTLRGSEYRAIFQRPEHLVLGEGKTVTEAKERIRDKVNTLISREESDETAALLIDKIRAFALEKEKNDYLFSKNSIEDSLIPFVWNGERKLNFDGFCSDVEKSHVALLGSEGGSGKTTILTKLFYKYLDNADIEKELNMIPLYVDAKSLVGENHLILRYLAKNLFDEHTAMTDRSTSKNIGLIDYEFSKKREHPRYLLIIDGYNEIPDGSIAVFDSELLEFLPGGRYSNVRIVVSGRNVGNNLPESVFNHVSINSLEGAAVSAYLREKGIWEGKVKKSMFKILSIPMYLKMYAETSADEKIQSKADLLCAFVEWQQSKDIKSAENNEKKALYQVLLKHVLPMIAHGMLMKNEGDSSFVLDPDNFQKILVDVLQLLSDKSYRSFYGREYREKLRTSDFLEYDELDLSDLSIEYFVGTCKILRQDNQGNFDFVHQIYRDFFCAWFISEAIKRSHEEGDCSSFSQRILDEDVIEFVAELLKEKEPFFDTSKGVWDYSCNTESQIVPLLDKIRGNGEENSAISVANITEMLKYARKGDLSGLDLSGLDLTRTILRGCLFYRYDEKGHYSTSFANSKINISNIFTENHFDEIIAACTNEKFVACIDTTGIIKLWERKRVVNFPIKVITDVQYSIHKMVFGPENDRLFAMTAHEILEIPIPEVFSSQAEPKTIFNTAKRLRDIIVDENGEILFSTNLNSFNYKSIYNPDAPDTCNFYGINSGACVIAENKRLAWGHIVGYEGLKIYDYFPEENNWKERKFGYSAILNDFISELEEFFINTKLYHFFPTDNEGYDTRRTYFSYIQQQFEDCTHDHDRIPAIIAERCCERLEKKNGVRLYPNQRKAFDGIVKKYEQILRDATDKNKLLMYLSGRNITGVSSKKDSNTILVSCTIDYAEKLKKQKKSRPILPNKRFDSIVLELDTETFETRFITRFVGDNALKAYYYGDDILVFSKYHFVVYDQNGSDVVHVTARPKAIRSFIAPENKNTFYAVSQHFIYEMDESMHCVRSLANIFSSVNITYNISSDGREFLTKGSALKKTVPEQSVKVIDLSSGRYAEISGGEFEVTKAMDSAICGNRNFKVCPGGLVSFEHMLKKDIMDTPYNLFVCGCDFRNVQGSVTETRYIQMLDHMGAVIDKIDFSEITVVASQETFSPSATELVLPEKIEERYVPYTLCENMSLAENCFFNDAVGGNQLYVQKTWGLINKGFYSKNDLEETDYSILEWMSRLNFATSSMMTELIDAGIIAKPTIFQDVAKRMAGPLHRTFKFVFRSQFCKNGVGKGIPIYTVCFPYGAELLKHITGEKPENYLYTVKNKSVAVAKIPGRGKQRVYIEDKKRIKEIRRTMALNQWFTLTVCQHKDLVADYSLNTVFDTDNHLEGRANIHGYIQLGERPFFAQAFRSLDDEKVDADTVEKVYRMCILAIYYRSLMRYGQQLNALKKQPVIVLIGEDFEHCKLLNDQIKDIYPNVRKLFTFDTLLTSKEAFEGVGNYFEFVGDVPYSVKLDGCGI